MANSLIVSSSDLKTQIADATTRFIPPMSGTSPPNATESVVEQPIRFAGTFSNLFVRLTANDVASATSCTVTLSLSRVASALTVSFGTSQTGVVEDQTHSATCVNTDEVDFKVVVTSVSGNHSVVVADTAVQFAPTNAAQCVTIVGCYFDSSLSAASTTIFFPISGFVGGGVNNSNESLQKYRFRFGCTASNLYCNLITNGRTTNTIIRTRLNGANGGQSLTYGSTQTGVLEDTTGTDTLAAGDDFCFSITTGTGTGTFDPTNYVSCNLLSNSAIFSFIAASSEGVAQAFNVTTNYAVTGGLTASTTEANVQVYPRFAFTAKELGANLSANTIATSATTIALRNNTANGNQALSYAAAQTGLKNDSVNTDSIASGTTGAIDYQVVTPNTSGSITIQWIGVLGTTAAAVAVDMWWQQPGVPKFDSLGVVAY